MTAAPKYPGDAIHTTRFEWPGTGELGDVRIMDYGVGSKLRYRVACFCPGREVELPGDTPKVEPECDHWTNDIITALEWYKLYISREIRDGWTVIADEDNGLRMRGCRYPECECAVSFPEGYRPSVVTECPLSLTPAEYSPDSGRSWITAPRIDLPGRSWIFDALADAFKRIFGGDPPASVVYIDRDIPPDIEPILDALDPPDAEKTGLWYWLDDWCDE